MGDGEEVRDATGATRRAPTGELFVGRTPELAALDAALGEVMSGNPRLVVVGGEPGIGKSRLLDEFARTASASGASVHWGRCREAGGAPPYWPWVQALRTIVGSLGDDELTTALGVGASDIAQVVPEVTLRLAGLPAPPDLDPDAARFRLFDAITTFLARSARDAPQVVLLDDIHAADEPSLLLLEFVAAELRSCRVLVVLATRTTEVVRSERLATLLHDLDRVPMVRRLTLPGLRAAEIERYLALALAEPPSPALVATVADQSDGNPLFLGEIVRLVQTERGLGEVGSAGRAVLPSDVRTTILRRVTHVSATCNAVLRVAAVIGRDVDVDLLARVAGRAEEELASALDEAENALLVTPAPDAPGRVRFTHALVRDALYGDVPARERAELHRRVAEELETTHAGGLDAILAELALHFFEAAPIGEAPRAVDYARRAGEQAARLLAYEEAARLFELALQALSVCRDHEPAARCDLFIALGDARMRSGDLPAAQATFLVAADLARAEGLTEHLARAALGYGGWFVWSALRGDPHFIPMVRDALEALGPEDHPLRVRLLARYAGGALRDEVDRSVRADLCEEAVGMARRLGDRAVLAYALDGRHGALLWPDNAVERLDLGAELVELGLALRAPDVAQAGHTCRCLAAMELADRRLAEAELATIVRAAEELRSPASRWSANVMASTFLLMEGRLEDAERLMDETRALSRAQSPDAPTSHAVQLFLLAKERKRTDEILADVEALAARYPTRPLYRYVLAHLHAVEGREREATWALESLAVRDFVDLPKNDEWLFGMSLLAEVVELVGDRRRAERVYDLVLPFEEQVAIAAMVAGCGAAARPLGILAATLGRDDDADRHFATAVAVNQRLGARLWVARSQLDWARTLLASGRPGARERAAALLEEAAATAAPIASPAIHDTIAALRDRSPAVAHGPGTAATRRIRRDGDTWAIDFDGTSFRVQDTKGMRYLAHLLVRPQEPVHVLELASIDDADGVARSDSASGAPILDERAKTAYRARLQELDEEIAEAESWGDDERVARAREEIQALSEEVAGALGQHGRDRRFASPSERARQSVRKALRSSVDRIARHAPALARHLTESLTTGAFCSYNPAYGDPPWRT